MEIFRAFLDRSIFWGRSFMEYQTLWPLNWLLFFVATTVVRLLTFNATGESRKRLVQFFF